MRPSRLLKLILWMNSLSPPDVLNDYVSWLSLTRNPFADSSHQGSLLLLQSLCSTEVEAFAGEAQFSTALDECGWFGVHMDEFGLHMGSRLVLAYVDVNSLPCTACPRHSTRRTLTSCGQLGFWLFYWRFLGLQIM